MMKYFPGTCLFFLLILSVSPLLAENEFAGGSGIPEDPYRVKTPDHLHNIRNHPTSHFKQIGDIDLEQFSANEGWEPVGSGEIVNQFEGTYNGNGYSILNLHIEREDEVQVGLFASIGSRAVLENIVLEEVSVTGYREVGALVGVNSGYIMNCSVNGRVQGEEKVGGMIGRSGHYETGIYQSYVFGEVSGVEKTGGLAGSLSAHTTINNCFSRAKVSGEEKVGGLLGYLEGENILVTHSYAAGKVEGEEDTGGLVGWNEGEQGIIEESYYDKEVSGQTDTIKGVPLTTEEMKRRESFQNWNFDYFWEIEDETSYPVLSLRKPFEDGDGTAMNPYLIADADQFNLIRYYFTSYFKQTEDIDLSPYAEGEGWEPIQMFRGSYDGKNHSINNLTIDRPAEYSLATFARLHAEGRLTRILLDDLSITGGQGVGGLVAISEGKIDYAFVRGTIRGTHTVGGLVASCQRESRISSVYVNARITGENFVGGLAGYSGANSVFQHGFFQGEVTGERAVGGVIGKSSSHSDIDFVISYADITGTTGVGGIIGISDDPFSRLYHSYATSRVTGDTYVGGLVGDNRGTIFGCYFAGVVSGYNYVGGIAGRNENEDRAGFVERSFYDYQRTGFFEDEIGVGMSTAEMKTRLTYAGWDFIRVWGIREGKSYPYLQQVQGVDPDEKDFLSHIAPYFTGVISPD